MEEDFVCEPVRINTVLFFVCILCICIFLCSVTILCVFFVNYSPPQIRNTCAPNWGEEAFTETNFTPIFLFLFIMYDVYVATVSSLNI